MSSTAECFLSRKYGLRVGAPYGGVCLPKDVPELTSLAPEGSVFREFLSGTGKINEWITNTPNLKVCTMRGGKTEVFKMYFALTGGTNYMMKQ